MSMPWHKGDKNKEGDKGGKRKGSGGFMSHSPTSKMKTNDGKLTICAGADSIKGFNIDSIVMVATGNGSSLSKVFTAISTEVTTFRSGDFQSGTVAVHGFHGRKTLIIEDPDKPSEYWPSDHLKAVAAMTPHAKNAVVVRVPNFTCLDIMASLIEEHAPRGCTVNMPQKGAPPNSWTFTFNNDNTAKLQYDFLTVHDEKVALAITGQATYFVKDIFKLATRMEDRVIPDASGKNGKLTYGFHDLDKDFEPSETNQASWIIPYNNDDYYKDFKEWATNLEILDTTHDPESIDVTAPDFEFTAPSDE